MDLLPLPPFPLSLLVQASKSIQEAREEDPFWPGKEQKAYRSNCQPEIAPVTCFKKENNHQDHGRDQPEGKPFCHNRFYKGNDDDISSYEQANSEGQPDFTKEIVAQHIHFSDHTHEKYSLNNLYRSQIPLAGYGEDKQEKQGIRWEALIIDRIPY